MSDRPIKCIRKLILMTNYKIPKPNTAKNYIGLSCLLKNIGAERALETFCVHTYYTQTHVQKLHVITSMSLTSGLWLVV